MDQIATKGKVIKDIFMYSEQLELPILKRPWGHRSSAGGYQNDRYPDAKEAVATSGSLSHVIKKMWLWCRIRAKTSILNSQIPFLPRVEDRGTCLGSGRKRVMNQM
ncbi:hypothetical protein EDD21DRAFT_351521 [Dissophora ornata]|nr:hypothetical protein EDD21DRAFT_351521 [Dissophora ornata]